MTELKNAVNQYAAIKNNFSDDVRDTRAELAKKIVDLLIAILGVDRQTACKMMFTKFSEVQAIVNRY
jgi:hypothetical protein